MTTFFIVILFIAVAWLTLAVISYNTQQTRQIENLEGKMRKYKEAFNTASARGNEHLRAFKEFADLMGYCVHEEHEVKMTLASIFGDQEPVHTKKLVVHKKEPVRKLKVAVKKTATRRK